MANFRNVFQMQSAKKDSNGRPRSLYVTYRTDRGDVVSVTDDNGDGRPKDLRGLPELEPAGITVEQYETTLAEARANETLTNPAPINDGVTEDASAPADA